MKGPTLSQKSVHTTQYFTSLTTSKFFKKEEEDFSYALDKKSHLMEAVKFLKLLALLLKNTQSLRHSTAFYKGIFCLKIGIINNY